MRTKERSNQGIPLTRFGQAVVEICVENFVPYRTLVGRRMLKEGIAEQLDRMILDPGSVVTIVNESHRIPIVRELATAIGTHVIVHTQKRSDTKELEEKTIERLNRGIAEDLALVKRTHSV